MFNQILKIVLGYDIKSMGLYIFRRILENDAKQQIENVAPKSTKAGSKAGNDPRIIRSVR